VAFGTRPGFDFEVDAAQLQVTAREALRHASPRTARIYEALRGDWLGHPLHPVLVDAAGGFWMAASVFDLLAILRVRGAKPAATLMLVLGLVSAVPAVLSGAAEWSTLKRGLAGRGLGHGLIGLLASLAYFWSLWLRLRGRRAESLAFSLGGAALGCGAAYVGGDMVFNHGAGQRAGTSATPGRPAASCSS
jgi:uncharacterized membrane protein